MKNNEIIPVAIVLLIFALTFSGREGVPEDAARAPQSLAKAGAAPGAKATGPVSAGPEKPVAALENKEETTTAGQARSESGQKFPDIKPEAVVPVPLVKTVSPAPARRAPAAVKEAKARLRVDRLPGPAPERPPAEWVTAERPAETIEPPARPASEVKKEDPFAAPASDRETRGMRARPATRPATATAARPPEAEPVILDESYMVQGDNTTVLETAPEDARRSHRESLDVSAIP